MGGDVRGVSPILYELDMKMFGSEIHDTALAFIASVVIQCAIGGAIFGVPDAYFSRLIVYFALVTTFFYWMITYSPEHFPKDKDETN